MTVSIGPYRVVEADIVLCSSCEVNDNCCFAAAWKQNSQKKGSMSGLNLETRTQTYTG